jgi:mono/diheme cytochrome c family protein
LKKLTFLLAVALTATACENVDKNLHDQISPKIEKVKSIPAPAGAVPILGTARKIDWALIDPAKIVPPAPLNADSAQRGKKHYDIYCTPCHGPTGNADTKVAAKMDLTPPQLISDRAKNELKDAEIFVKILASDSLMPRYRAELEDNEAWDVVAYVRQLQKAGK